MFTLKSDPELIEKIVSDLSQHPMKWALLLKKQSIIGTPTNAQNPYQLFKRLYPL